jgi:hypothetical protein
MTDFQLFYQSRIKRWQQLLRKKLKKVIDIKTAICYDLKVAETKRQTM